MKAPKKAKRESKPRKQKTSVYYMHPEATIYIDPWHTYKHASDYKKEGFYKRAYSELQAMTYIKRDIAYREYCSPSDIYISYDDIEELFDNSTEVDNYEEI